MNVQDIQKLQTTDKNIAKVH
jgi:hypothetical protein